MPFISVSLKDKEWFNGLKKPLSRSVRGKPCKQTDKEAFSDLRRVMEATS